MKFIYIIPVHGEARTLAPHVAKLFAYFERRPYRVQVVLAENGSRDNSARVVADLAAAYGPDRVIAASTPAAGLGYGLALGLETAFARHPAPDDALYFVLTAADLPFGFSDFEAFERLLAVQPGVQFAVGSKAHPESRVHSSSTRALLSTVYRVARRVVLGMRTADSQGSLFVRDRIARSLLPLTTSRDFFFSTELVYHAEHTGTQVIELPVELQRAVRRSTVKPVRDGAVMLRQLLQLRARAALR